MSRAGRFPARSTTGSTACPRCRRAASAASRGSPRPGSPSPRSYARARPDAAARCPTAGEAASSRRGRREPRGGPTGRAAACRRRARPSRRVSLQCPPPHRAWTRQRKRCRRRRPRVGLAERLRDLPAVVPDSTCAGSRTISTVRPSTRRAVLETLRSATSRTRDNCSIVCVCAFIRCARCRSDSAAGGRDRTSATATSPAGHRSPAGATRISVWTDQSTRCVASRRPKEATRRGPLHREAGWRTAAESRNTRNASGDNGGGTGAKPRRGRGRVVTDKCVECLFYALDSVNPARPAHSRYGSAPPSRSPLWLPFPLLRLILSSRRRPARSSPCRTHSLAASPSTIRGSMERVLRVMPPHAAGRTATVKVGEHAVLARRSASPLVVEPGSGPRARNSRPTKRHA